MEGSEENEMLACQAAWFPGKAMDSLVHTGELANRRLRSGVVEWLAGWGCGLGLPFTPRPRSTDVLPSRNIGGST